MSTHRPSSSWCSKARFQDNDGYVYRPGDLVFLSRGTQHFSTTKTGCTLAVFIESWEENL